MTATNAFWLAYLLAAVTWSCWTLWVWRRMAVAPMFSPVGDLVAMHPLSRGHLVDPHVHDARQAPRWCLAWRPSPARALTLLALGLTPVLNLVPLLCAVGFACYLVLLVTLARPQEDAPAPPAAR